MEVVAQELQGALGARREAVTVGLEHLEGGGERGQRGAELVTDVRVEPGLALDALLELVHHGVERVGQPLEVRVGGVGVEAGVELTAGDGPGSPRDVGQRAERAHAGEAPERDAEIVVTTPATRSVSPSTRSVWSRSERSNTSKYAACTEGIGTPTTISAVPWLVR